MIGCLIIGLFADKFGRVRALQLMCALGIISAVLQAASVHISMFLTGRFLSGLTFVITAPPHPTGPLRSLNSR